MDDEPTHCGRPMVVSEYDTDLDAYLYHCMTCMTAKWWETDDETWK